MVTKAMKAYIADIRSGEFPTADHCYQMIAGEEDRFLNLMDNK
jgi:ketopantoate hydroxymethyltransferase